MFTAQSSRQWTSMDGTEVKSRVYHHCITINCDKLHEMTIKFSIWLAPFHRCVGRRCHQDREVPDLALDTRKSPDLPSTARWRGSSGRISMGLWMVLSSHHWWRRVETLWYLYVQARLAGVYGCSLPISLLIVWPEAVSKPILFRYVCWYPMFLWIFHWHPITVHYMILSAIIVSI